MEYPLPNFHFSVEWGPDRRTGFSRVHNLKFINIPIETRKGDSRVTRPQKQPSRQEFENVVLERPVIKGDNDFFEWWKGTSLFNENDSPGSVFRTSITIKLLNDEHEPVLVWQLRDAFPVSLTYSDLDALGKTVLYERLEVAFEGVNVIND